YPVLSPGGNEGFNTLYLEPRSCQLALGSSSPQPKIVTSDWSSCGISLVPRLLFVALGEGAVFLSLQKSNPFKLPGTAIRRSPGEEFSHRYLSQMRDLLTKAPTVSWKSQFIDANGKAGAARANRIVEEIFSSRSFQNEIARVIDKLGGPQSSRTWN